EDLAKSLCAEFRDGVRAPVRPPALAHTARRENEGGVLGLLATRQQTTREDERRVQINVHDALPCSDVVVLDRPAVAEDAGIVHEPVEPTVSRFDLADQVLVLSALRPLEVELRYRRLGTD